MIISTLILLDVFPTSSLLCDPPIGGRFTRCTQFVCPYVRLSVRPFVCLCHVASVNWKKGERYNV